MGLLPADAADHARGKALGARGELREELLGRGLDAPGDRAVLERGGVDEDVDARAGERAADEERPRGHVGLEQPGAALPHLLKKDHGPAALPHHRERGHASALGGALDLLVSARVVARERVGGRERREALGVLLDELEQAVTDVVGVTRASASGDWETATPLPSMRIVSPQERKRRFASATERPVTSGTVTRLFSSATASPSTYSMTSEPSVIPAPAAGSWPITVAPEPEST